MPPFTAKTSILPNITLQLARIQERFGESSDLIVQKLDYVDDDSFYIGICYLEGLTDQQALHQEIMNIKVVTSKLEEHAYISEPKILLEATNGQITSVVEEEILINYLFEGSVAILINGMTEAFTVPVPGGERRSIQEPTSQTVIRGPKEGFVEDISTNIALVRRKIKSPDLHVKTLSVGRYTQTKVSILYMKGIAEPYVVSEILQRIQSIDTDSILESGYIEEFIQDGILTPFPTMLNTERPDAIAGGLLEGLVAIIVDGTPFVLMAPVTFSRFLTSSEDYYQRYDISSFLRLVRLASFFIALFLPSFFIAITTFHVEMLPTTLLITLAAQREATPFTTLIEAFLMELTFEVIREAGVRMPRAIGPAISIVGALVLGQAAVQAGLVSAAMVIVVSFTAISNFVLPSINMSSATRLLRFFLMILAGTLGLFGILIGITAIIGHLVSLQSFGVPYLDPTINKNNLKDIVVRVPWWKMKTRPTLITAQRTREGSNYAEQAKDQKPDPLS
ncbi:spore germination protein [Paenibacillus sp. LS1]|nr:spore germination protein [Paenibacillus sp. LS1]MCW3792673.1 spore germination protein [Paenibacillus sp. LS1]